MSTLEMTLLFDYYGELLTPRQRLCLDMRYNQDMSLGEIAEELELSRQGVHDNLSRAEALLRNVEEKTGCVRRDTNCRRAVGSILDAVSVMESHSDPQVVRLASRIRSALLGLEE